MSENKEGQEPEVFRIEIMKNKPKKNAVTYRIETVDDILKAVTPKNINKFMREFKIVLLTGILMKAIADAGKKESKASADTPEIGMPYFDWIDD